MTQRVSEVAQLPRRPREGASPEEVGKFIRDLHDALGLELRLTKQRLNQTVIKGDRELPFK